MSMVVIKKFENVIPVDFGEFELKFVTSDENILKLANVEEKAGVVKDKIGELKGTTEDIKLIYDLAKELWVELFDEETFEKVYNLYNKSCMPTLLAVFQTLFGITQELGSSYSPDKLIKYLNINHA
nr:MAG TPA: tail assembly chaperone [Caudoviricetes sp.]